MDINFHSVSTRRGTYRLGFPHQGSMTSIAYKWKCRCVPGRKRTQFTNWFYIYMNCFDINSHMRCCHDAREYANQNFNECTLVVAWTRRTRNEGFSRLYCNVSYYWVLILKLVELHEDIIFTKQLVYESHLEKTQGLLSTARINSMLPNYTSTVRWFLWDVEFVPVFTVMTSCWMIVNYSKIVFSKGWLFKVYGAITRYLILKIDVPWRTAIFERKNIEKKLNILKILQK